MDHLSNRFQVTFRLAVHPRKIFAAQVGAPGIGRFFQSDWASVAGNLRNLPGSTNRDDHPHGIPMLYHQPFQNKGMCGHVDSLKAAWLAKVAIFRLSVLTFGGWGATVTKGVQEIPPMILRSFCPTLQRPKIRGFIMLYHHGAPQL